MAVLYHFSEDPNLTVFRPHVPATATGPEPLVWAIDESHAPSYWFPRDCPRACCWMEETDVLSPQASALLEMSSAKRMHAIDAGWLERVRECRLYVYELDPAPFVLHDANAGYWVSRQQAAPIAVKPAGDLLSRHAKAGIELRVVSNLWPLIDAICASSIQFSIIRKANALPREQRQSECPE